MSNGDSALPVCCAGFMVSLPVQEKEIKLSNNAVTDGGGR